MLKYLPSIKYPPPDLIFKISSLWPHPVFFQLQSCALLPLQQNSKGKSSVVTTLASSLPFSFPLYNLSFNYCPLLGVSCWQADSSLSGPPPTPGVCPGQSSTQALCLPFPQSFIRESPWLPYPLVGSLSSSNSMSQWHLTQESNLSAPKHFYHLPFGTPESSCFPPLSLVTPSQSLVGCPCICPGVPFHL